MINDDEAAEMTNYDESVTSRRDVTRKHSVFHLSRMATAPDVSNVTDYPLDSPKPDDNVHAVPDVPAITQDEVIAAGKVPDDSSKKSKKADDASTTAPKKAKIVRKKKKIVPPAPSNNDTAPRYYYDIQNFIVTNGVDLEQFGILPPSSGHTGVETTAVGKRVHAPAPVAPTQPPIPVTATVSAPPLAALPYYTYQSRSQISERTIFCPDCGERISRHVERKGTLKGERVLVMQCPETLEV